MIHYMLRKGTMSYWKTLSAEVSYYLPLDWHDYDCHSIGMSVAALLSVWMYFRPCTNIT